MIARVRMGREIEIGLVIENLFNFENFTLSVQVFQRPGAALSLLQAHKSPIVQSFNEYNYEKSNASFQGGSSNFTHILNNGEEFVSR